LSQIVLIAESCYILAMATLKLSLGLFFLRIMVAKWQRISIYVILAISTLISIAYFLFALFECGFPVESSVYWGRFIEGNCVGPAAILGMSYTHALVTAGTDLSLLCLAIVLLNKSKMKLTEKRIVVGIFVIATA
jgi:hypothetical protein